MLTNSITISKTHSEWPKSRKILFVICLIAFHCQLYRITAQYYSYKTQIQTKLIVRKDSIDLPAITLCTERDVVYLKKTLRKKISQINHLFAVIDKSNDSLISKEVRREKVYKKYTKEDLLDYRRFFDRSIKDRDFVECTLLEPTNWMDRRDGRQHRIKWYSSCPDKSPVIESLVRPYGKCFTYFSRQNAEYKHISDLEINAKHINSKSPLMRLILPTEQFEDALNDPDYRRHEPTNKSVFLFIHDPHRMPAFDQNEAIRLETGRLYDIRFWSTTKQLLKPPFDTNCNDYSTDSISSFSSKSSDQCIRNCYLENSKQHFDCLLPGQTQAVVNDDRLRNMNPSQCHRLYEDLSQQLEKKCQDFCRQDCHQTDYHFDYRHYKHKYDAAITPLHGWLTSSFSLVYLRYRTGQDYYQKHKPVHTMCDTIQKLFIALLIWFGVSIFSMFAVIETVVNKAKPISYIIPNFDDKVAPVYSQPTAPTDGQSTYQMIAPKFSETKIGSNVKLEHFNDFISKVVDSSRTPGFDLPNKKF